MMPPPLSNSPAGNDIETKPTPWYKREFHLGSPVKAEEVMNFSRQASSFIRAGVPILDSLAIVAEESSSKGMRTVLVDLRKRLREGSSFGDALAAHPRVFPAYYVAMVRSAELTGQLDDVLDQLAHYFERDIETRRKIKSSLTYPLFVMGLAIVAVIVMSLWVLPKFKDLYTNLNAKLPLPTRMLLGFTDFVGTYWWVILGTISLVTVVSLAVLSGENGKRRRDRLLLKLPVLGGLFHLIAVERFCRVLSALVGAGVTLPDAVQVSSDSTNNRVFQSKLAEVRDAMMRGAGLARPIHDSGMFPPAARQMIRVGESTGTLDEQLRTAASFYERELTYRLRKTTDLFEPIIVVGVGLVVGFVAVAQVAAMYSVYNQV
jgi:type IV pilus assembly protein PilC